MQNDACVDIDTNHYSVSWKLIGAEVTVQVDGGQIRIRHAGSEVACHKPRLGRRERAVDRAHLHGIVPCRPDPANDAAAVPTMPLGIELLRSLESGPPGVAYAPTASDRHFFVKLVFAAPANFLSPAAISQRDLASVSHFFMKLARAAPESFFSATVALQESSPARAGGGTAATITPNIITHRRPCISSQSLIEDVEFRMF